MDAIYIPRLIKAPNQTEVIPVQEYLPDLPTLTPVQGEIEVRHQGNYLEVSAHAETITTLNCNRCLQCYNHRLDVNTKELIWLEAASDAASMALEQEIAFEDLVETLPPEGYFNPREWLYEQLCLVIPQQQLCDPECPGIQLEHRNGEPNSTLNQAVDSRWASLAALKQSLPDA